MRGASEEEAAVIEGAPAVPEQKRPLVERIIRQLRGIPGVAAVVLGGSCATGTDHAASDVDLGLYYSEAAPFSIAAIQRVAEEAAAGGALTVTGFYEWGAWVNGGAWLHTPQGKVDFVYRSLEHVRRTIAEARRGVVHHDYDQQPTYGFYSVIYLAETSICIPLHDPDRQIADLKRQVEVYPPALKERLVADSLWAVEFTLIHARAFAARGDVYNTAGCLTRAASDLTQALFALNERYYLRDKQVMETVAAFSLLPPGYPQQIDRILARPGSAAPELAAAVGELEQVWRSVTSLPGVEYQPRFRI